jgi:hypothetical protein
VKRLLVPFLAALVAFVVCIPILAEQAVEEKPAEAAEEAVKYVGDKKCKPCHGKVFKAWEGTPHAKAFASMLDSVGVDENCLPCHTVGYGKPGGFVDTTTTAHLKDVQCESCHGPGSMYMKLPIMKDREKALANGMILPDEALCKSCHTEKESPEFDMEAALKAGTHYTEEEEKKEE